MGRLTLSIPHSAIFAAQRGTVVPVNSRRGGQDVEDLFCYGLREFRRNGVSYLPGDIRF